MIFRGGNATSPSTPSTRRPYALSPKCRRAPEALQGARRRSALGVRPAKSAADGAAFFLLLMLETRPRLQGRAAAQARLELPFELRQKSRQRARLASGEE